MNLSKNQEYFLRGLGNTQISTFSEITKWGVKKSK